MMPFMQENVEKYFRLLKLKKGGSFLYYHSKVRDVNERLFEWIR